MEIIPLSTPISRTKSDILLLKRAETLKVQSKSSNITATLHLSNCIFIRISVIVVIGRHEHFFASITVIRGLANSKRQESPIITYVSCTLRHTETQTLGDIWDVEHDLSIYCYLRCATTAKNTFSLFFSFFLQLRSIQRCCTLLLHYFLATLLTKTHTRRALQTTWK